MVMAVIVTDGFSYDFFAREWEFQCKTCLHEFYTPTKHEMLKAWDIHTHKVCGGGW